MTELELYKFIEDHEIEYNWDSKQIYMFVDFCYLDRFSRLLGSTYLTNNTLECVTKDTHIAYEMTEICEHFDIELKNVFPD